jgi:hypothetical protein
MLLNLIHVLGELEDLRQKCEGKFTCDNCPLKGDKDFCDEILILPEKIVNVVYGGSLKC